MNHLSTTSFSIEIREFEDSDSLSGRAWVIDLLDPQGEVIIEGAGVADNLSFAMKEAGQNIESLLTHEWSMPKCDECGEVHDEDVITVGEGE